MSVGPTARAEIWCAIFLFVVLILVGLAIIGWKVIYPAAS